MIRAVMFDFGGVLSRFGFAGDSSRRFAKILGCDVAEIGPKLGPLIDQWRTNRIDSATFWREAAKAVGAPSESDYDKLWRESEPHALEPAYYELARQLRGQGIITGILSDVGPTSAYLVRQAGGYGGFEPVILSCEVGMSKRDPRLFELVMKQLALTGPEIMLVDDIDDNLKMAGQFDIVGMLAREPQATIAKIRALLASKNPR